MWTSVDPKDRITLLRCIAIARQMQMGYDRVSLQVLQHFMRFRGVQVAFYQDAGFQMFIAYAFSRAGGRWLIAAMGFVGATPQNAGDVMAAYLRDLLQQPERSSFYSIKVPALPLAEFFKRLTQSALLRITTLGSSEIGDDWRIEKPVTP